MDSDRWKRIERVYYSALEVKESRRPAFLNHTCGRDESLRREVETLLSADSDAADFLEVPALEIAAKDLARQSASDEQLFQDDVELAGRTVSHYRVLERLGGGGMGVVFRAEDLKLGRLVALKFLPRELAQRPEAVAQLHREARAASALNHPHICVVHDIDEYEGHPFIVMELLQGETLKERIAEKPLRYEEIVKFGIQILDALEAAHANGIIHRDVKPANIFVTNRGDVKVLDFGLAKLSASHVGAALAADIAETRAFVGTLPYMAPEQLQRKSADERTDIYAFGAVLFEMSSGRRAFPQRSTSQLVDCILNNPPSAPRTLNATIPAELEEIILKCLAKDPAERFQSAKELAEELQQLATADKSNIRSAIAVAAVAIILLVAGALVAVTAWLKSPSQPRVESVRQLTDDGEVKEESAAIDTDGSRVYFTETHAGNLRLAQVSVSGGQVAPVSTQIPAVYSATIAPDLSGLLVVANSVRGSHPLWFQPLPAGPSRRLGDFDAFAAVVNPQNGQIVYVNGSALYTAERDGTSVHKICDLPGIGYMPAVSPDGKKIRVTVLNGLSYSLWEVGFTGKDLYPLGSLGSASSNAGFGKWAKDGHYFVFQSAVGATTSIWARSERPGFLRSSSSTQLTNGPLSCSQPAPSYDGKQIFARCAKLRDELVRYDRKSQAFIPFLDGLSAIDVTYSPDGKWVVYVSYPDRALWRMRADGTDRLQLVYSPMTAWYPNISPDSTRVVFFGGPWRSRMHAIYVVSLAGGEPKKIVDQGFLPDWSPDGNSIVFDALRAGTDLDKSENLELRVLDLKSGKVSVIPHSQGKSEPLWISQNTLVAGLDAGRKLVRYDFTTQTWSDLADGPFSDWTSKGSKYVYCTTYDPAPPAALRIRLSDGRREPLANLTRLRRISISGAREFSLTPNGDLLFARDIGTDEIYALDVKWP